ncbi:MAG TPA: ABC transporter substrate-binding protein [Actinomycetota bacterium]|nr:ABC transporter substrate-binding protein [Actinomycetota bacterium]
MATDSRIGTQVAGYRVESLIGRGGMSEVYLAHHEGLDRKAALKLLSPELAESDAFRKRFIRESRLAAALDHPNVVPIYEAGDAGGLLFIAMRYVPGSDLKSVIAEHGPLEPDDVVRAMDQMGAALDAAHAAGLVHRDVKPGNVLLSPATAPARVGHLYLADFGLTKKSLSASGMTKTGQFVGTLDYMAPEQIRSEPVDARTDVYSLGCVLYQCLTGEPPFVREAEVAVMYAHLSDPAPVPSEHRRGLPPEIDAVVARAMAKEPDERYASAGELAAATREALRPVLTGDAGSGPVPGPRPPRPKRRRRRAVAGVGISLAVVVAVVAALVAGGGSPRRGGSTGPSASAAAVVTRFDSNSVGIVDGSTGRITGQIPVGASPSQIAVGEGAVWVTNTDDRSVSRIDPSTGVVIETIPDVGSSPTGIATGGDYVWVTNSLDGTVARIDPSTNTATETIAVGNGPLGIVYAAGLMWVANTGDATVTRIDPDTGATAPPLPIAANQLAFGDGTLWASDTANNRVVRIDPGNGTVTTPITVGNAPTAIAFGDGAAWVANALDGTVSRIDPDTNSVTSVATGQGPAGIAVGAGAVWVSNDSSDTLVRIDPTSGRIRQRIPLGNRPQGVAISGDRVLVSVRESDAGHTGGTLSLAMNRDFDYIDPALAYDSSSWNLLRMTNDGLVAFNQASGLAGTQLVPDLAAFLPQPTNGTTYTFTLRPGIRYSNGRSVRASDVPATFARDFLLGIPTPEYYEGIVGAEHCANHPKDCDLSDGIVADDAKGTVTFHLVAPDPEFLDKLAMPFAYIVPAGTPGSPRKDPVPVPATGPYRIADYTIGKVLHLERNPEFHEWWKPAQPAGYPDAIEFDIGGTPDEAVQEVLDGNADAFTSALSQNPPSEQLLNTVETRYASEIHTSPQPTTVGLFMNTNLPPFDDPDVRRALNIAADRNAAVTAAGGPEVAEATCQILPAHSPGYAPYCPYQDIPDPGQPWPAPNIREAQRLVDASGTKGDHVTFWSWGDLGVWGGYAKHLLESLGYRVSVETRFGLVDYFGTVGDSRTKAQIGTLEWISDYPAASGFFVPILTCDSFLPANPGNANTAQFCDPAIDAQISDALDQQASNPEAARGLWERIDRETVDEAPWVPLVNLRVVDVLRKGVGNYQYTAPLGMLIDQLWVQ